MPPKHAGYGRADAPDTGKRNSLTDKLKGRGMKHADVVRIVRAGKSRSQIVDELRAFLRDR